MKDNYLNNQSFNKSLDEILDLAFLDGIKDKYRRNYIESIITKMYYSDLIKVNNARIPREQIIKQLSRITPDAIEFMMKKMLENTGSMCTCCSVIGHNANLTDLLTCKGA